MRYGRDRGRSIAPSSVIQAAQVFIVRRALSPRWAAVAGVVGSAAFLLARLAPDIHGKPLFEDEAVAGLIGARPVGEIVTTILWDRGGAPLHFLLVHLVKGGPQRSGALAEAVHSDPSTISRQVAHLVRLGLVERTADPEDREAREAAERVACA